MALLPMALPLTLVASCMLGIVRGAATAVGEPPPGPAATDAQNPQEAHPVPRTRFPSPQCRACCESGGADCGRAYMGTRPGLCCTESSTCCPLGTVCVKHGQRCALHPVQPPPRPAGTAAAKTAAAKTAAAKAPPPAPSGQLQQQPPGPQQQPPPVSQQPPPVPQQQMQQALGGRQPVQGPSGQPPSGQAGTAGSLGTAGNSQDGQTSSMFPGWTTSMRQVSAKAGNLSLIQIVLGAILLVSLVFCCIAVFCLKELSDCLFGANGGSRVAPVYAGQQQQFLATGMYPGQFPGQPPGIQFQSAYPGQQFASHYNGHPAHY